MLDLAMRNEAAGRRGGDDVAAVAASLGVAPRTVDEHYDEWLQRQEECDPFTPLDEHVRATRFAGTLPDAIRALRSRGVHQPAGVLERALWEVPGRRLADLYRRELGARAAAIDSVRRRYR